MALPSLWVVPCGHSQEWPVFWEPVRQLTRFRPPAWRECFDVLATYWQQGEATNPRSKPKTPKALPDGLTTYQQEAIQGLVKARLEGLPQNKRAGAAIKCWSALKNKFGCTYSAAQHL